MSLKRILLKSKSEKIIRNLKTIKITPYEERTKKETILQSYHKIKAEPTYICQ